MKNSFVKTFKGLIIVFIICVTGIQAYMLSKVSSMIKNSNEDYLNSVSNSIEYELKNKIEVLDKTAKNLAMSGDLQTFLTTEDIRQKEYGSRIIEGKIYDMNSSSNRALLAVGIDTDNNVMKLGNVSEPEIEIIKGNYPGFKNGAFRNGIYFAVDEGVLSIYKYENVMKYNLSYAEVSNVGAVVVFEQINLLELGLKLNILDSVDINIYFKGNPEISLDIFSKGGEYKNMVLSRAADIIDTGWVINESMYDKYVSFDYFTILSIDIVLIALIAVFIILFMLVFYKMYKKPMLRLMKYLSDYSLSGKNEVLESVEVSEFNDLLDHINSLFVIIKNDAYKIMSTQEMLYEKELDKQNVLLYMYQLQIHPHFLYNTLGCISYFAVHYNAPEILEITDALTGIFRYSVNSSSESNIKNEITYTQRYMKIIKIRYPDKVELSLDVSDELMEMSIPSMIFQPIVENAFKHGILPGEDKGIIRVRVYQDEAYVYIDISDNGVGMTAERCAELNNTANNYEIKGFEAYNIGLANVNKRIRLKFGSSSGLTVTSELNKFTKVSIKIKK